MKQVENSKGAIETVLSFSVIIFSIIILILAFTFQQRMKGGEVSQSITSRHLAEASNLAIISLHNQKVEFVQKSYIETLIDAALYGANQRGSGNSVYYGTGIGQLRLNETIPPLFDRYLPGKWELEVVTPDGNHTYGGIKSDEVVYVYKELVPVPKQRLGKVILYVG